MFFKKKEGKVESAQVSVSDDFRSELQNLKATIIRMATKIEMLEAKERAQEEIRNVFNNKFDKYTESLGELKEMFKIMEDENKELQVKIVQTNELVKAANPMKLMTSISKLETKNNIIDGKFALVAKKYNQFRQEFDRFAHKLKVFKGEDELIKLQARVKNDLSDTQKMNRTVGMHASKLENHFVKINEKVNEVNSKFNEFKDLRNDLESLQKGLEEERENLETINTKVPENIGHEFESLHETLDTLTDLTLKTFRDLKERLGAFEHLKKPAAKSVKKKVVKKQSKPKIKKKTTKKKVVKKVIKKKVAKKIVKKKTLKKKVSKKKAVKKKVKKKK